MNKVYAPISDSLRIFVSCLLSLKLFHLSFFLLRNFHHFLLQREKCIQTTGPELQFTHCQRIKTNIFFTTNSQYIHKPVNRKPIFLSIRMTNESLCRCKVMRFFFVPNSINHETRRWSNRQHTQYLSKNVSSSLHDFQ